MHFNMLLGPRKRLKQIIEIKHNGVKNFRLQKQAAAIYKYGQRFEFGTTVKKSS